MKPQKRLGQNFIKDLKIIDEMLSAADLTSQNFILEVGPGKGAITEKLAPRVKNVLAIEKDKNLVKYLQKKFKNQKNIKIIPEDILKIASSQLPAASYKIISNLPFYLTSRFLRIFLELRNKPTLMVLVIQKEVAQRICDQPPHASLLSNSVQFYANPQIIDYVPKSAFYPVPEVDAAIIKIKILLKPKVEVENIKRFFQIMKIGFSQKRKQLHNNLTTGLHISKEQAQKLLAKSRIDPTRRAQTLDLKEWKELYEEIKKLGN